MFTLRRKLKPPTPTPASIPEQMGPVVEFRTLRHGDVFVFSLGRGFGMTGKYVKAAESTCRAVMPNGEVSTRLCGSFPWEMVQKVKKAK